MKGYHEAAARCAPQSSTSEAPRPPTRVDEMHRARLPLRHGHSLVWRPAPRDRTEEQVIQQHPVKVTKKFN